MKAPTREAAGRGRPVAIALVTAALFGGFWIWMAGQGRSRDPGEAQVCQARAQRLAGAGRTAEALAELEKAKRADPEAPAPHLLGAQILAAAGRHREARDEALAAHRLAPDDAAATLAALNETPASFPPAEVEPLARQAAAQAPRSAEAHDLLGRAIAGAGDSRRYPEALRELEEASLLDPASAATMVEIARVHSLMGDHERAAAAARLAGELLEREKGQGRLTPSNLRAWLEERRSAAFWQAQACQRLGRETERRAAAAAAASSSALLVEVKSLSDRAAASPPDTGAQARLETVIRRAVQGARQ